MTQTRPTREDFVIRQSQN